MGKKVTVKYYNLFKTLTKKEKEDIIINDEKTIIEIINDLIIKYGDKFRNYIFRNSNELNSDLRLVFNGRLLTDQDLNNKLSNEDTIELFISPVGG